MLFRSRLLRLRRAHPVLVSGDLTDLAADNDVIRFVRSDGERRFIVLMNLAEQERTVAVNMGVIAACTEVQREGESVSQTAKLAPAEAMMIEASAGIYDCNN